MKKILLIITSILLNFNSFSQNKKTIFIEYFVPISEDVEKNYFVFNDNGDYWKYCSRILEKRDSQSLNSYLPKNIREILFKKIFTNAKNGDLVVYQYNDGLNFYGPAPNDVWVGKKQILKKPEIQRKISSSYSMDSLDKNGYPVLDDNGDILIVEYLEECNMNDFIGIKFYEEWTFDYKNVAIQKKILFYAPAIKHLNPETLEMDGVICPFIVENKNSKTNEIIANDFYSNCEIFCDYGTEESWYSNNVEPSVKFPFIKKAMTKENNIYYECLPPYKNKISNIEALTVETYRDSISDDYEPVLNADGDVIKIKYLEPYIRNDINSFGFVEDWYFNQQSSSFRKDVKGVSLEIMDYNKIVRPIFLLRN